MPTTATVVLDREKARALAAAAANNGVHVLRTVAVLWLHRNALRVDEACAVGIADLGEDSGHRVLQVVRKGGRKAKIALTRPPRRPRRSTWPTGPSGPQ